LFLATLPIPAFPFLESLPFQGSPFSFSVWPPVIGHFGTSISPLSANWIPFPPEKTFSQKPQYSSPLWSPFHPVALSSHPNCIPRLWQCELRIPYAVILPLFSLCYLQPLPRKSPRCNPQTLVCSSSVLFLLCTLSPTPSPRTLLPPNPTLTGRGIPPHILGFFL